jgi:hypothetical protein
VLHLLDRGHVGPDLGEEALELLAAPEALEVVLGRRPDDPEDVRLRRLLAPAEVERATVRRAAQGERGAAVGRLELRGGRVRDPVADVLDGHRRSVS